MVRGLAVGLALAALLGAGAAAAQDAPDVAGLLPASAFFGPDWRALLREPGHGGLDGGQGAAAYGGPAGARVLVYAVAFRPEPGPARAAWGAMNETFDAARSAVDFDYGSEREAEALPKPAGCADARRGAGADRLTGAAHPVGITLCAADPDRVLLVVTSGEVLGMDGITASDAVVERILAGATGIVIATPAA